MTVPTVQRCWLLMGYGVPLAPHFFLRCGFLLRDLGTGLLLGGGLLLRHLGARPGLVALAPPPGLTSPRARPARPAASARLSAPALPAGRGLLPRRALLF